MARPPLPEWRLPLRAWQRDAHAAWNQERPADALIVATPGAGKTRFAARLAHELLAERSIARVIVVVPREHLKAQVARAMAGAWIQLDHRFRNVDRTLASDLDGAVVTYQQVAAAPHVFAALARTPTLVLLDEIHHAGETASWGQALRDAFGHARYRVSLSGTPFRSDGAPIPFVQYAAGECVALRSYDYARALGDGVCRALVFPLHGGEAEWISRDGETMRANFEDGLDRRHASERLRTALTQAGWLGDVLEKAHVRLLEARALGHADAGGLVAAMNQDHARFVAGLLESRCGQKAELVVSDLDDASRRIARFATSRVPWIVAVHMVSEGVEIPRLRVGVFASNVVSELYFRQFCGRFVRTGDDAERTREAFVYLPDDARLRGMASAITADVRHALRDERGRDEATPARTARGSIEPGAGEFASIAATALESHTLDFGPLFNPAHHLSANESRASANATAEATVETHAERREALRRNVRSLVARASNAFSVDHKLVHATLNQRCGGPIATA
ncbi:MAG: DEAD/DEAH box helicase family protein, partial [Candidatus Eremiobacteraeota bacterium]|nr:DEAD/DEAH box helicase family protein [Candidatus Eremiobacteraeota bacterium]